MKTFEKILVPLDFAVHSMEALRVASDVAIHYSASMTLLYVYEPIDYALPEGYVLYTPEQLAQITTEFETRLAGAKGRAQELGVQQVSTRLLQGSAALEIVDFAKTEGVGLIVLGTHGRKGLAHVLMGSVAERVLRTAPCPVLSVKAPPTA
jgi:nucleotide-binding universal stress UspA family protein